MVNQLTLSRQNASNSQGLNAFHSARDSPAKSRNQDEEYIGTRSTTAYGTILPLF